VDSRKTRKTWENSEVCNTRKSWCQTEGIAYMKLSIKRSSRDVYTSDLFDEIRRIQDYTEQMVRLFSMLDSRFGGETLSLLTDVTEEDDKVVVTTDLPGIDRENVELSLRDNFIIINAGKGKEEEAEKRRLYRERAGFHALLSRNSPL
jgi:HSP20 family protein